MMPRLIRAAADFGVALLAIAPSALSAQVPATEPVRPAFLEASVNGRKSPDPMLFLIGPDGELYAQAETFERWRMLVPESAPISFEGQLFYPLTGLPGLVVTLTERDQSVAIEAAASWFKAQRSSFAAADIMPMTPASTGGFLNYDILAEALDGQTGLSGVFDAGFFTPRGVFETGFVTSIGSERGKITRLNTSWSVDRVDSATSLRLGDSVSSGASGAAPVRFAGLHYYRNYAVQPGFITFPLPSVSGSAALSSVVDIYVNNVLRSSSEVEPGPFELTNIPVLAGDGTVQIVVRDLLGREMVSEQSFYASTRMLKAGLHDFSYEAGFLRENFGISSGGYGAFMASTAHRYGLTNRVTIEANAQASEALQMGGAGITFLAFDLGQISGAASLSNSKDGTGYRLAASFERNARNFSFGLRTEVASARYSYLGIPEDWRAPHYTVQSFASLPFAGGGLGANLLYRTMHDDTEEVIASLSGSFRVGRSASAYLFARRVVAGEKETAFGANLSLSFGGNHSGSIGVEHGRNGLSGYATVQKNLPAGLGDGYSITANSGGADRIEGAYYRNFMPATLGIQASRANRTTGLRLSASGSAGWLGGKFFAARSLGESFAAVRVDGYPGLRVYADDQIMGSTDSEGYLIVPSLRPFQRNRIRIDDADLPIDASVDSLETFVRPYAGAGSEIRFVIRRERGVLMQVRLENGDYLPAGARVRVEGSEATYVTVPGGEIYIPGFTGTQMISAIWTNGRCRFTASAPDNDDPQPRLEGLICREDSADGSP